MPQVKIPPPYRGPTGGRAIVHVDGPTVGDCLAALAESHPGLGELLQEPGGALHRFVTVFVNGDEVERSALDTRVRASDELEILTALAGG